MQIRFWILVLAMAMVMLLVLGCDSDSETQTIDGDIDQVEMEPEMEEIVMDLPPTALPFTFTRDEAGDPLTDAEIKAFTAKITGFWKEVDYFKWLWYTGHGMDESYDADKLAYKIYWQDTWAEKDSATNTITFHHSGGADNIMIRTPKVLTQAIAGYLMTGDELFRNMVIQFANGITANFYGLLWGENDPNPYIPARAIFPINHSYEMEGGRKVAVDYDPVKEKEVYSWNAHTIPYANNPIWGEIWVRNMRSKDDVPHMFRVAPFLIWVIDQTDDEEVRVAAQRALDHLEGFGKEIADNDYKIRTKGKDGVPYVPHEEENPDVVKDLACFNCFEWLDPLAECNSKLNCTLLGYGEAHGNECESGYGNSYENAAVGSHYFNEAIIRYFHVAAVHNALMRGQWAIAMEMMEGLAERTTKIMYDTISPKKYDRWYSEMAPYLLAAGSAGLPLTWDDVRVIQEQYSGSVDFLSAWPNWDLWDESVPDGRVDFIPNESDSANDAVYIRPEDMAGILEFCFSPLRNPASHMPVDCDIVRDPTKWGTTGE